ncbi:hypothetical protein LXA43DRAFT_1010776 [Ganoderma leucocontextum]|nr:hypothetical protein LXA43DRAFT_1010776 [Ganoderma leucocontextum]
MTRTRSVSNTSTEDVGFLPSSQRSPSWTPHVLQMGRRSLIAAAHGSVPVFHSMFTKATHSFIHGRGSMLAYLLLSLFPHLIIPPAAAVSVNITVDDTFGNSDSTDSWHIGSPTEQCNVCAIKPSQFDTSQILDQSWHHATYYVGTPIQVQVTFRGTAVYVYNVIPNYLKGAHTVVNLSFSIDGQTVGQFTHTPDSSSTILYNHLVYSNTGLSDSVHTLVMSVLENDQSLIIFDYLVYTTEVDRTAAATTSGAASSSASSSPPSTV